MKRNGQQRGLLLHKAILDDDFWNLSKLLNKPNVDVNRQDANGDTPLLICLRCDRSHKFIKRLLQSGANITIDNNQGITPFSFAVAHNFELAELLLQEGQDVESMCESAVSEKLYRAIEKRKCRFGIVISNRGLETERHLVYFFISNSQYSKNVAVRELNELLDEIEEDLHIDIEEYAYNGLCANLIKEALRLNSLEIFEIIWDRVDRERLIYFYADLLYEYVRTCTFDNRKFIECLDLLIDVQHSSYLTSYCYTDLFYEELSRVLCLRKVLKHDRCLVFLKCARIVEVTIQHVIAVGSQFGFNEEVMILLQYYKPKAYTQEILEKLLMFVTNLERQSKFSIDNLHNLALIPRMAYKTLLNSVPEEAMDSSEKINLKKQLLNKVPTLFEITKHVIQKRVQKVNYVLDSKQFSAVVKKLPLPLKINDILCHKPPLYYI